MTINEKISEGNKLITEYMGYQYEIGAGTQPSGWYKLIRSDITDMEYREYLCRNDSAIKYHKSWDWLMQVVEKIEETTPYKINILECDCEIYSMVSDGFITHKNSVIDKSRDTKIEAVYEAIVDFIEWYNRKKKEL